VRKARFGHRHGHGQGHEREVMQEVYYLAMLPRQGLCNGQYVGHYFLRTNIKDIGAAELWQLYGSLRTIEDAFRFMKSSLGMRPVYHQKERRGTR